MGSTKLSKNSKAGKVEKATSKKPRSTTIKKLKRTGQFWLSDKERTCLNDIDPASKKFCHRHLNERVPYVKMKLTPMEVKTVELLREWDMTEQVYREVVDFTTHIDDGPTEKELREFYTIHEVRAKCTNLAERFHKKMKI
ncbi:TPA: hypothetical protein N0F65_012161 [Lagenidium giganteum]|uniref:Nucleolar protein 16 n=1 Tax=Lagenidium giganteum TaxID=4803 RepID=A0AAV2YXJ3_9STRA|nr:TPA: hypothetical protein N0F65_012161 [Lagenidium giganteum]